MNRGIYISRSPLQSLMPVESTSANSVYSGEARNPDMCTAGPSTLGPDVVPDLHCDGDILAGLEMSVEELRGNIVDLGARINAVNASKKANISKPVKKLRAPYADKVLPFRSSPISCF